MHDYNKKSLVHLYNVNYSQTLLFSIFGAFQFRCNLHHFDFEFDNGTAITMKVLYTQQSQTHDSRESNSNSVFPPIKHLTRLHISKTSPDHTNGLT